MKNKKQIVTLSVLLATSAAFFNTGNASAAPIKKRYTKYVVPR